MPRRQRRRPDIPADEHVARHCNHQRVIRDRVTKQITGIYPQAFELRPQLKETYLSVNHFECLRGTLAAQFKEILAILRTKRSCGKDSALARLNAGEIITCGQERGHSLRLRASGSRNDPSYVQLLGLPLDNSDQLLLGNLAKRACVEVRAVSEIDEARE
jgi:hypothetical protein